MTNQPSEKQLSKPRWFTPYWILIFILTIIIGLWLLAANYVPIEKGATTLIIILIFECLAYYARTKSSISLNRIMYILMGAPIGFVLWYMSWLLIVREMYPKAGEDLTVVIISMLICFSIGALIGDFIGRLRNYKGPEPYQP